MKNLITLKFWLDLRPPALLPIYENILIGFIVLLTVAAILSSLNGKKYGNGLYGKIWKRIFSFSLTNAILGLLLLFFSYEVVPFLSARFWFILWGASMAIWAYFIFKASKEIPKIKEQMEKEKEFNKYIP
jgi:hypothetical protein